MLGRSVGPKVRRRLPHDATLCLWSPTIVAGIYVIAEDRYVSIMRLHCCSQEIFDDKKKKLSVDGVFARDSWCVLRLGAINQFQ